MSRRGAMIEGLKDQISRMMLQRPHSRELLASYEALLGILQGVKPSIPDPTIDSKIVEMKQKEGFPLFSREDLPIDLDSASKALRWFFLHLSGKQDRLEKAFNEISRRLQEDENLAEQLYSAVLARDMAALQEIAKQWGLPSSMLYFLAITSLKPSLSVIREKCRPLLSMEDWEQGYCPLCGSEPYMAYFDKKGKRHLHCELCGTEWAYPRVKCPFCQNEDQDTLGYFEPEEEEGLRVYFCKRCVRYIKTIDRRAFEKETPMDLEYLATLHLDILAEEEGFK